MDLIRISRALVKALKPLRFGPPVTHVYSPLEYARASYECYVKRFGRGEKEVVMFGMNPGPWGMVQTGVPFGEVSMVRDWLGIREKIGKPEREHPKRPVGGLSCGRSEVSGLRIWGWARDQFGMPERFFERFFIANYCPLAFLEESGRNRTPDKLPMNERRPLMEACDKALRQAVDCLQPRWVIGVGGFAESRAHEALNASNVNIGRILHPSPANPEANRDWAKKATKQFKDLGIKVG